MDWLLDLLSQFFPLILVAVLAAIGQGAASKQKRRRPQRPAGPPPGTGRDPEEEIAERIRELLAGGRGEAPPGPKGGAGEPLSEAEIPAGEGRRWLEEDRLAPARERDESVASAGEAEVERPSAEMPAPSFPSIQTALPETSFPEAGRGLRTGLVGDLLPEFEVRPESVEPLGAARPQATAGPRRGPFPVEPPLAVLAGLLLGRPPGLSGGEDDPFRPAGFQPF